MTLAYLSHSPESGFAKKCGAPMVAPVPRVGQYQGLVDASGEIHLAQVKTLKVPIESSIYKELSFENG